MNLPELVLFLVNMLKSADPNVIVVASPNADDQVLIVCNGRQFRLTIKEIGGGGAELRMENGE